MPPYRTITSNEEPNLLRPVRNPARERSRNLNREVWESPSVYGGEDVNNVPDILGSFNNFFDKMIESIKLTLPSLKARDSWFTEFP